MICQPPTGDGRSTFRHHLTSYVWGHLLSYHAVEKDRVTLHVLPGCYGLFFLSFNLCTRRMFLDAYVVETVTVTEISPAVQFCLA
jgi:hypothetical protein